MPESRLSGFDKPLKVQARPPLAPRVVVYREKNRLAVPACARPVATSAESRLRITRLRETIDKPSLCVTACQSVDLGLSQSGGGNAASSAPRLSGSISTSTAARFSCTCSSAEALGIAITFGCDIDQRHGERHAALEGRDLACRFTRTLAHVPGTEPQRRNAAAISEQDVRDCTMDVHRGIHCQWKCGCLAAASREDRRHAGRAGRTPVR